MRLRPREASDDQRRYDTKVGMLVDCSEVVGLLLNQEEPLPVPAQQALGRRLQTVAAWFVEDPPRPISYRPPPGHAPQDDEVTLVERPQMEKRL